MNTSIKYTQATPGDELSIRKLLKNLRGDESNFDINKFYIAKEGLKIIGCIRVKMLDDSCFELSSLAVQQEYQHQGIGSELVKGILANEQGGQVYLLTSGDKEVFYKKFGFSIVELQKLPEVLKKEYDRIIGMPFAKDIKVIVMVCDMRENIKCGN